MTVQLPKLKRDWIGRYVRLRRQMENGWGGVFEAGEVVRVSGYYRGLELEAIHECPHCRRRGRDRISRVSCAAVELLPADYRPASSPEVDR